MRNRTYRSWPCAGVIALALSLAACGSRVEPKDFVGALSGPAVTSPAGGQSGDGATTSGAQLGTKGARGAIGTAGGDSSLGTGTAGVVGTGSTGKDGTSTTGVGSNASGGSATGSGTGVGAAAGMTVGSCAGFKNGLGITDKQITIATIADVSGPIPNQFKSAHDAVRAYATYFNSTSSICGRKLVVKTYDSGLSASGDHDASKAACSAFALVGSFSAFDEGGADITQGCGQPDIRNTAVTKKRQKSSVTHAVYSLNTDHIFLQPWSWIKQQHPEVVTDAAFVYLNASASGEVSKAFIKGTTEKLGYDWKKIIVVDVTSVPNWNAYANQLKSAGIKFVSTNLGGPNTPKLREAMEQADYHPIFLGDGSAYFPGFIGTGDQAKAIEGAYVFTSGAMLEEANRIPEMQSYLTWVARTGGVQEWSGAFSWSAAQLFVRLALNLGGKLSRQTLLTAMSGIHNYTGNGIMTPMDPGGKVSPKCATVMVVKGGKFTRASPFPYSCGPLA